jgi:hypothetical protein
MKKSYTFIDYYEHKLKNKRVISNWKSILIHFINVKTYLTNFQMYLLRSEYEHIFDNLSSKIFDNLISEYAL